MWRLAEFRRPAYTGANRCWPCTTVNLLLLGAVCVLVGVRWPAVGVAAGAVGAGVVWQRGYLIPYTPTFAPRLVSWLGLDSFHHTPPAGSLESLGGADGNADGERTLRALVESGVVVPEADGLTLATEFRTRWEDGMSELADLSPSALAEAALDASAVASSADPEVASGRTYVVLSNEAGDVAWIPRPVAVAETAAARVLRSFGVDPGRRDVAARSVCAFLETCPGCGDDVVETAADACCGGANPAPTASAPRVLACESCGVRFFTLESD